MSSSNDKVPVRRPGGRPGKQCYMIWRSLFEIDMKYVPIKPIGKGAYGVVCSAKDSETGEKVAIKKVRHAVQTRWSHDISPCTPSLPSFFSDRLRTTKMVSAHGFWHDIRVA